MTKSRGIRARRNSPLDVRLARYLVPNETTGCIEWRGSKAPGGYGNIHFAGRTMMVHRAAWTVKHGEIPAGLFVCHRCDNPACANVDHLFLGTSADNMADMRRKGRGPDRRRLGTFHQGELCTFARLTASDVLAIRASSEPRSSVAERFGVSVSQIARIRNRINWRHI